MNPQPSFFRPPYYYPYTNNPHTNSYYDNNNENTNSNNSKYEESIDNLNSNDDEKNKTRNSKKISDSSNFIELFGLKLYFDDILLICLIYFLYREEVRDNFLFISLILLLIS